MTKRHFKKALNAWGYTINCNGEIVGARIPRRPLTDYLRPAHPMSARKALRLTRERLRVAPALIIKLTQIGDTTLATEITRRAEQLKTWPPLVLPAWFENNGRGRLRLRSEARLLVPIDARPVYEKGQGRDHLIKWRRLDDVISTFLKSNPKAIGRRL